MNGNSRSADWAALKLEYAHDSTVTTSGMAKKYNMNESTVRYRATKYQWFEARETFSRKLEGKLLDSAASKDAAAMLRDLNTKQMKWNEEMRYAINSLLKCRTDDGKVVMRDEISLTDVNRAIASYAELYRLDRLALGASTENVQPATARDRIDEMTDAEVIEELQRVRERVSETVN